MKNPVLLCNHQSVRTDVMYDDSDVVEQIEICLDCEAVLSKFSRQLGGMEDEDV